MIQRESWYVEANDWRRLRELLRLLNSREDYDAEEVYGRIAKLTQRLGLKEIPPMNNVHKRSVFLQMFPSITEDLRQLVMKITQGTAQEMLPLYSLHNSLESFALRLLELIGRAGWQWVNDRVVDLTLMEEIKEGMKEWDALKQNALPPALLRDPGGGQPWLTRESLKDTEVDLPSWLYREVAE